MIILRSNINIAIEILTIGHSLYDFLPLFPELTAAWLMGLLHTVPEHNKNTDLNTCKDIIFCPHIIPIPRISVLGLSYTDHTHTHTHTHPQTYTNIGQKARTSVVLYNSWATMINTDVNGRVCGALVVQFGHRHDCKAPSILG